MTERKVFNKRTPTDNDKYFIALPSDAKHYVHHPIMSASKLFLYALLIDYYNVNEGFAWPSVETLSIKYDKAPDTTSRHLDELKAVGLIDFPEKGYYVPLVPLDEEEFFAEFPEAMKCYKESIKRLDRRRESARDRMRAWRLERGYA